MGKFWVVLLAGLPVWVFLAWAAWWLISDALDERRRARAAARYARLYGGQEQDHERGSDEQASAA